MTDGTWDGFVSPNWNEPAGPVGSNWNGGSGNAPDGTASFPDNNYNRYNIVFTQDTTTIQQLVFGSTKPYTFTIGGGSSADYQYFIIAGNGISTGAAAIPTFVTTLYGELDFTNGATAGNAIINSGGSTAFKNTSTANQATITTTAAQSVLFFDSSNAGKANILISSVGGSVLFFNNSTASNAQIQVTNVNGDAVFHDNSSAGNANIAINNSQSNLSFTSNSTAQNAVITDFGNSSFAGSSNGGNATINVESHGSLQFTDTSSVQNAIITIAALGSVAFNKSSAGGTGGITNLGSIDFSNHAGGIFSLGSIAGDGLISFGTSGVQLQITGLSLVPGSLAGDLAAGAAGVFTDTISGVISGSGGVTMDAAGTLVLSAANTFTGDTVITNGTVELAVGGSIAGNFDFQNFAPTTTISETLKLDASNQIGGTINNFAQGDSIDITFHSFAAGDHFVWTENGANIGGTLSLLNAAGTVITTLNLSGMHTSAEFAAASDGDGGTVFTDSALAPPPPTSVQQEIIGLYAALYNRAAESPGYFYWVGIDGQQTDATGVTVATAGSTSVTLADAAVLGQAFVNTQSTFFNQIYAGLSDSAFINALYVNIGSNAGDPTGIAYWAGLLAQAEASGQGVQAARAGLVGQFVHDLIDINLAPGAAALGLTDAQYQAALVRQEAIDNKITVSETYLNASQQPNGAILIPQAVGDAAFNAAVTVLESVTSDPATVTVAITGINNAVAHQDLTLI